MGVCSTNAHHPDAATAANGRATQAMKNIVVGEKNRQQPGSLRPLSTR
jgi:hypothetical protein